MGAGVKVKTRADKLAIAEDKALVDTLANILAEIRMQTLGLTLAEVEAKGLVKTLKDRIAQEVETFYNTVYEGEAELLVNKVANRILVIESQGR